MKIVRTRKGKSRALMNPSEKGAKFADDLRTGLNLNPCNGSVKELTPTGASYRMGYLSAQKDSANAYKARKRKKGRR